MQRDTRARAFVVNILFLLSPFLLLQSSQADSLSVIWGFDDTPIVTDGLTTSLPIAGALATFNQGVLQDLSFSKYDTGNGSFLGYENLQGQAVSSHFDTNGNFLLAPSLIQSGGGEFFRGFGLHSGTNTSIKVEHFDKYANATELTDYPLITPYIVPILPALDILPGDEALSTMAYGARAIGVTAGATALVLTGGGVIAGGFADAGLVGAFQAGGLFSAELAGGGVVLAKTQEGIDHYFHNPDDPITSRINSNTAGFLISAPMATILPRSSIRTYLPDNFLSLGGISNSLGSLYQSLGKKGPVSNWYIQNYAGSNNSFFGGVRGLGDLLARVIRSKRTQPEPLLQQHISPKIDDGPISLFSKITVDAWRAQNIAGLWNYRYHLKYGISVERVATDLAGLPTSILRMLRKTSEIPVKFADYPLRNLIHANEGSDKGIYILTTKGQPYFLPGDPKIAKHHSLVDSIFNQANAEALRQGMPMQNELPRIGFAGEYRIYFGGADIPKQKAYYSLMLDGSSGSYTALLPIEKQQFRMNEVLNIIRGGVVENGGVPSSPRFEGWKLKLFDVVERGQQRPKWGGVANSPGQVKALIDP